MTIQPNLIALYVGVAPAKAGVKVDCHLTPRIDSAV
jgi:hypothetical protein